MCLPIAGERLLYDRGCIAQYRADLSAGLEQSRGLAIDDIEVARLAGVGIVRIHELQDFALGNRVGGIRHDVHDRHATEAHHHLKSAGVQEIAYQHACGIAEFLVRRLMAAPQR